MFLDFDLQYWLKLYPWLINIFSISCAYLLSNNKVVIGRVLGCFAATNWIAFGFLSEQYAFIAANIIFLWIYISAIVKFSSKRDSYKKSHEEQREEIARLRRKLNKDTIKAEQFYSKKQNDLISLSNSVIKQMEQIKLEVKK
ncbi:hypothetical protein L1267_20370 [Pseudoalteromonas sp. OFAV1]|uniref:hypothetical protein n=1 Tax=Pseudoalteromonas sp. OFAV1 TaxID=2908892 RepID=UPI001F3B02FC|nr:hypothetical protein [Pseudoalteromonas sp. OFAV1]MCF2902729.1 hypothetical protein [Pseudoalteromonas sp. OFAV1]